MSFERWMNKDESYVYNGILFSCNNKGNLAIYDSLGKCGGHYFKFNKWDRETQIAYDFNICRIWKSQTLYNK